VAQYASALNRCFEHQRTCKYVHYRGVFDINVHICKHILHKVCTCARVCTVCSLVVGEEVGGVQLVYVGHLFLGLGRYFRHAER